MSHEQSPHRAAAATTAPRILVCDDEANLRGLIRAALGNGYSFAEAGDGHRALELAQRFRPHLIVLDMMMPGRSGLDVLAELRSDRELAEIPVILVTARELEAAGAAAARADVGYVQKPFRIAELVAAVERLLLGVASAPNQSE